MELVDKNIPPGEKFISYLLDCYCPSINGKDCWKHRKWRIFTCLSNVGPQQFCHTISSEETYDIHRHYCFNIDTCYKIKI